MQKLALPVVILAFCAWGVSLGGIASLQEACTDTELVAPKTTGGVPTGILIKELSNLAQSLGLGWQLPNLRAVAAGGSWFIQSASMAGVRGFSATVLQCRDEVYRYYWAIVAFQFAVVMAAFYFIIAGALKQARGALIGLFIVATLLYMQSADSFLTAETVEWYKHGQFEHRARTMTTGCIMTSVANCLVIFVLGFVEDKKSS